MGTAFGVCFGYWLGGAGFFYAVAFMCSTHLTFLQILSLSVSTCIHCTCTCTCQGFQTCANGSVHNIISLVFCPCYTLCGYDGL